MYTNIRSGFIKNNKGLYFAGGFLLVVGIAVLSCCNIAYTGIDAAL